MFNMSLGSGDWVGEWEEEEEKLESFSEYTWMNF